MIGARYCGECGAHLRPAGRFCAACGTPIAALLQDPQQLNRPPPAWPPPTWPPSPPQPGEAAIPPSLTYEVAYPGSQRRLSVLARPLLLAPHLVVLVAFGALVLLTGTLAAVAVVFTGRYPRGLWEVGERYLGWLANVATALALLRDEYPPWGAGATPVRFGLDYPGRSGRLAALLRPLLALPSLVAYGLLGYTWAITWLCGWAAILLTGRHPEGLWRFGRGLVRWLLALTAYVLLLTDRYPPFSVGSHATARAGTETDLPPAPSLKGGGDSQNRRHSWLPLPSGRGSGGRSVAPAGTLEIDHHRPSLTRRRSCAKFVCKSFAPASRDGRAIGSR